MQCIFLAAGRSTRLLPVSLAIPKCLLPVRWSEKEQRYLLMVEILLQQVSRCNIHDVVIVVGHLKEQVITFLGDGSRYGMNFTYIHQEHPAGEADALFLAGHLVTEPVIVVDTDNYVDDPDVLVRLVARYDTAECVVAVSTTKVADASSYAVVKLATNGRVLEFFEKPSSMQFWENDVKMGLYVLHPSVLNVEPSKSLAASGEYTTTALFTYLLTQGQAIAAERTSGQYADIGTWPGYHFVLRHEIVQRGAAHTSPCDP